VDALSEEEAAAERAALEDVRLPPAQETTVDAQADGNK
jgi:hypothetical protein